MLAVPNLDALAHFMLLEQQRQSIEAEIGSPLEWEPLPGQKRYRIALRKLHVNPMDESDWPKQHEWIVRMLESFDKTFRPRIRDLDAANYVSVDSDDSN